jgi:hypothetical protein
MSQLESEITSPTIPYVTAFFPPSLFAEPNIHEPNCILSAPIIIATMDTEAEMPSK